MEGMAMHLSQSSHVMLLSHNDASTKNIDFLFVLSSQLLFFWDDDVREKTVVENIVAEAPLSKEKKCGVCELKLSYEILFAVTIYIHRLSRLSLSFTHSLTHSLCLSFHLSHSFFLSLCVIIEVLGGWFATEGEFFSWGFR